MRYHPIIFNMALSYCMYIISSLFNCILIHGFIPNSFCVYTLKPIFLTSLSDSTNYRAKIMDACIINKQCHVFKWHDLLFAYKANPSIVQCVFTVN